MWIIFGAIPRKKELGQMPTTCDRCARETVHSLEQRRTWFTLFFLPIFPLGGQHEVRRCNLCGQESPGGLSSTLALSSSVGQRRCPHCAELIHVEARVCRFCGHSLTPEQVDAGHQQNHDWGQSPKH
jgi:hypothetical protein